MCNFRTIAGQRFLLSLNSRLIINFLYYVWVTPNLVGLLVLLLVLKMVIHRGGKNQNGDVSR